ncbi:hypothetical protein ACLBXM_07600 [Xanthobacteraceae bacterium A53D]
MSNAPTPEAVAATARAAGFALAPETAARVARAVAPAMAGFAPIAKSLPFDLEPATFVAVQQEAGK